MPGDSPAFFFTFDKKNMATRKDAIAAEFYAGYISLAGDEDVQKAIRRSSRKFRKFLKKIPKKKIDYAYAEGKWTIREVLQHLIDAERVFTYRALRLARKDGTPLPGFDENQWARNAQAVTREWKDLVNEFEAVRTATEFLFGSFHEDQLQFTGTASNHEINTLALGYIIAGHVNHHMKVMEERYL